MKDLAAYVNNYDGTFPNWTAKNASGGGATDGTEWVAGLVNDGMWGWSQALLSYFNMTPNDVAESVNNSQILDALKGLCPAGTELMWGGDATAIPYRFLLLHGQGVLRSSYGDLDSAVYVGDGNNATAAAYYHADDQAGTIRNIAGDYLILPESRGYAVRGLDIAGTIDPDGASRTIGHLQADAMQRIKGRLGTSSSASQFLCDQTASTMIQTGVFSVGAIGTRDSIQNGPSTASYPSDIYFDNNGGGLYKTKGTGTGDGETRMANRAVHFMVRY